MKAIARKKKPEINMYQSVIVTLTNGKSGTFTGAVLVTEKDIKEQVAGITFVSPQPLPAGCKFAPIKED